MSEKCSYTDILEAKDGSLIPVRNGIAFHSKYNPIREGDGFASQCAGSPTDSFFVILGLCGGFHVQALCRAFPDAYMLLVERSQEDISFLKKLPVVQDLLKNKHLLACSAEQVKSMLTTHFLPAEHAAIQVLSLRAWEQQFAEDAKAIKSCIQETLAEISADFSVQSHFGGIWQRNILANLKAASSFSPATISLDRSKKAAVIAAGPSLDESVEELLHHRKEYVIIATDTGYRALLRHGIVSDVAVSVDAQMISHAHFFDIRKTHFVLDLSANPATGRKIASQTSLQFVQTGHPLSAYASQCSQTALPLLQAGSGTVTIAAADFAIQTGFQQIVFFGADFGYLHGKAYARGTYLDDLYNNKSSRLNTSETQFDALLFRTPLVKKSSDKYTSQVLESYGKSLDSYMGVNNFIKKADNTYIRAEKAGQQKKQNEADLLKVTRFDFERFSRTYASELRRCPDTVSRSSPLWLTLLPYVAWLRTRGTAESLSEIVRQAYTKTLEYMEQI